MRAARLPVCAMAALVAACAADTTPEARMANVKQMMGATVEPAAEVYWDAVGTIIDMNGIEEIAPSTPEEWEAVRNAAIIIRESGNLLMSENRAVDEEDWMSWSQAMTDAGQVAFDAAQAEDTAAVFDAGAEVYFTCSGCHASYALDTLRPSDTRSR